MKRILPFLIVACQSMAVLAQDDYNKTPYLSKSLAQDAINSVVVSTSAGGIDVSGKSGEAARIEVYIKGNNGKELSKEEIQKRFNEIMDKVLSDDPQLVDGEYDKDNKRLTILV